MTKPTASAASATTRADSAEDFASDATHQRDAVIMEATSASASAAEVADAPLERTTYLTKRPSDGYGPRGAFLDLTEVEAKAGVTSGILGRPTPEQLARRR